MPFSMKNLPLVPLTDLVNKPGVPSAYLELFLIRPGNECGSLLIDFLPYSIQELREHIENYTLLLNLQVLSIHQFYSTHSWFYHT